MNDFVSYDTPAVYAINSENEVGETTAWNGTGGDMEAGALLVTSPDSDFAKRLLDYPGKSGDLVTDIVRYPSYQDWDDDPYFYLEHPISTYKLTPGVEFQVPETNIATGQGTFIPGDLLAANTSGEFVKASANNFVVFQTLTSGVEAGTASFRVLTIASQLGAQS